MTWNHFSTQHCMTSIGANEMLTLYTPDVIHTITKKDFTTNVTLISLKMVPKHWLFEEKHLCALGENIIEMHVFQGEEYDGLWFSNCSWFGYLRESSWYSLETSSPVSASSFTRMSLSCGFQLEVLCRSTSREPTIRVPFGTMHRTNSQLCHHLISEVCIIDDR